MIETTDNSMSYVLNKAAARIVEELLSTRVFAVEFLHQGMMTFKCRVRTENDDDVIVRFYPASRSGIVLQEPDLLLRCYRAGMSVPKPIGDSRSGPSAPLSYVVYRRISGETLADRLPSFDNARRRVAAEDLASHLYRLQNLTIEGAGEIVTSMAAQNSSWDTFVEDAMCTGLASIKDHKLLEPSLTSEIERVIRAGAPTQASATQRLVWGDINFGNILVEEDGRVTGLIDFEGCLSGDPLATLGYAAAVHGTEPFFSTLRQAWPRTLSEDEENLVAWYTLLRALRLARYAHLPLPTGRPRDPLVHILPGIIPALRRLAANC